MSTHRVGLKAEDHRLEARTDQSLEELARHRWHWTRDESNPDRVSIRQYAERIGRNQSTVTRMVSGYIRWTSDGDIAITPLSECIATAGRTVDQESAARAVADLTGSKVSSVQANQREVVRSVRQVAEDNAERRGTSVSEEIPRAAKAVIASRETTARRRAEVKASKSRQYLALEGHLVAAQRHLGEALLVGADLLEDEEREALSADIRKIRDTLNLLDLRVTGTTEPTDWDAALATITGGK